MKNKLLFLLTAISLLLAVGCKQEPKQPEKIGYNFEDCYMHDYNDMSVKFGRENFMFYWSQAKMDKNINDTSFSDTTIVSEVVTLFQIKNADICYRYTHPEGKTDCSNVIIDTLEGQWTECLNINPDSIDMCLRSAIICLNKLSTDKPATSYIVMRCPLYPPFPLKPYWFFGDNDEYIVLDSNGKLFTNKSK